MNSKASVKIDDQSSESFNIMKRVRQGCPLITNSFQFIYQ